MTHVQTQCAWCKRYRFGDGWADQNPEPERPVSHSICPDCQAVYAEWPRHRPEAHDAPIPGRQWHGGCNPDGGRIHPETGLCDECGEAGCKVCGRENCPDHDKETTT